jgi:hypothetical protein
MPSRSTGVVVACLSLLFFSRGADAADTDDDDERPEPAGATRAPDVELTRAPLPPDVALEVPFGFYKDRQGRVMQVSFDLQRRLWLGVAYAPRRRPTGVVEVAPAAFDFGYAWDFASGDGRTRRRFRVGEGQVQLHPFALDVTGLRFDLSHRYESPLLRVTTLWGEPERHDLFLNVGLFIEAAHFDSQPRGVSGEQQLTLGTVQATLDLWQSADLRSYVRLRAGPGVDVRFGPWGDTARFVGFAPATTLEGNLMLGRSTLQQLSFALRGDVLRSVSLRARPLPGDWAVAARPRTRRWSSPSTTNPSRCASPSTRACATARSSRPRR